MIGFAQQEIFTSREIALFERAARLAEWAPYKYSGEHVRCHELARAVGKILGLDVCDGRFGFVEHSWLWLEKPEVDLQRWNMPRILDVYVPGQVPQVALVDVATGLPARYLPAEQRKDIKENVVEWLVDIFKRAEAQ